MESPIFSRNTKLLDAQSMAGTITSSSIDISDLSGFAVHEIYTGAPNGTITVEVSNDDSNFIAIDTNSVSSAGQKMVNVTHAHYRYVRIKYSFSSGTGNLTVYVSGKRL